MSERHLSGTFTPEMREVYATLYYTGPCTEAEIAQELGFAGVETFLARLMDRGVVTEVKKHGKRPIYPVYDVSDPNLSPAQIESL